MGKLKGVIVMSLGLKIFAIGGLVYFLETRRETVYLKRSRRARLPITILKYAMIVGFIVLVFAYDIFFIKSMFSI